MTITSLFTFGAAMLLLAASPGPGVFATIARALASGFFHAALLVAGIVLGDLIFLLLAIYGLSSLAEFLGGFFTIVKYAGGLYIIWLGLQIWSSRPGGARMQKMAKVPWQKNFFSGLAITLANPKVIFFYLGFLPSFVDLTQLRGTDVMLISSVVVLVLSTVLLCYAYLAVRTGNFFKNSDSSALNDNKRTSVPVLLNKGAGGIMIAAGSTIILRN